jgi:predicted TIM-barrel fold metal-dependent hydrolase
MVFNYMKVIKMKEFAIIDAHAHIFPEKLAEKAVESIGKYYGIPMSGKGTVPDLLENGRRAGIRKYVVHSTATKVEQVETINNFIASVQAKNSELIGFGTLHPGLENIGREVERIISLGLQGIKLHPDFQEFNIDDEDMMPIYGALEGKLPVLIHMGDEVKTSSRPERLSKVIRMFPNLTVIAAHLGGYQMWGESVRYLVGKNLYFDTSSTLFRLDGQKAADIIRAHGVEKVLFGTDYPMWVHEEEVDRLDSLELTQSEKRLILCGNAQKLFRLDS